MRISGNGSPGDSVYDGSILIPIEFPEGVYEIQTGIIDGSTLEPRVKLAMEGVQEDGWYQLGRIDIKKNR